MSLINVTKSTYKQSLRDYVILTISYLRAQTIETSSLPNDSVRLLFKQIEIFLGILTVLFNCKDFFEYTRELLVVLVVGISRLLGEFPVAGAIRQLVYHRFR